MTARLPCGTRAAYLRHLDHDEPACDPCKEANAAHRRAHADGTRERHRAYQRARRRAAYRLQQAFPREWRMLLRDESWKADQELRAERLLRDGAEAG